MAVTGDFALNVCVEYLDHIYHLLWDPVVTKYSPQGFSVKAIKGLFIVNKGNVDHTIPFRALFQNRP